MTDYSILDQRVASGMTLLREIRETSRKYIEARQAVLDNLDRLKTLYLDVQSVSSEIQVLVENNPHMEQLPDVQNFGMAVKTTLTEVNETLQS